MSKLWESKIGYFVGGHITLGFYDTCNIDLWATWKGSKNEYALVRYRTPGSSKLEEEVGRLRLVKPPENDPGFGWFWLSLTREEQEDFVDFIHEANGIFNRLWEAHNKLKYSQTLHWKSDTSAMKAGAAEKVNGILEELFGAFQSECLSRIQASINKDKAMLNLRTHNISPVLDIDDKILFHQQQLQELLTKKANMIKEIDTYGEVQSDC